MSVLFYPAACLMSQRLTVNNVLIWTLELFSLLWIELISKRR